MKYVITRLVAPVILVLCVAFAGAEDVPATPYGTTVSTMDWQCGDWSGWFTSSSYCGTYHYQCWCRFANPDGRYEDQYRTMECRDSVTGQTVHQYEFRTILTSCCQGDLC